MHSTTRRSTRWAAGTAALALMAVLAAGCGSTSAGPDAAPTTVAGAPTTTVATTAPAPTEATTTTTATTPGTATTVAVTAPPSTMAEPPSGGDTLPDGDTVALLKSATATSVTFDVVQFLTGQAAIDAAVAHHDNEVDPDGTPYVDNDYYVVNDNPKLRTMPVTSSATITQDGCDGGCPDQIPSTLGEVAKNTGGYFTLTVASGQITAIHQLFVP